jgi:proline iminopeptidase
MSLLERSGQDELLLIRNDVMTVYREICPGGQDLFPLRYVRAMSTEPGEPGRAGSAGEPAPTAPTVLIIPDGPATASVLPYDLLRRQLALKGVDTIMVEHRGVGLSRHDGRGRDLPPRAMTVASVVDDLVAVLDHALVDRVAVHGTGYGAHLAMLLAALHPERVRDLVLDSPMLGASDELLSQQALRAHYWEGTVPGTDSIAATVRRLDEWGVIDARRAGPVLLAVHEYGGVQDVAQLVDLLSRGRGRLTWNSVRQVLNQQWLSRTPYVHEPDVVSVLAQQSLGEGAHADGGPLDPLWESGRAPAGGAQDPSGVFQGEEFDLRRLAPTITAPTLVLAGDRDLVSVPAVAQETTELIPGARLLSVPGTGHSVLDTHAQLAQIAVRWAAVGAGRELAGHGDELALLPRTPTVQALSQGLRLALAAERVSPWRLRLQSARTRREGTRRDAGR